MFVNVFAGVGMHLDNLQNASLGNWCMVGYAIGAVIAMVLGGKGLHLKYLFAMGFFFLSLSAVFMYFEVQTAGVYERLKYAVIIRATGMMILYALTAAYANQRMPLNIFPPGSVLCLLCVWLWDRVLAEQFIQMFCRSANNTI